MTEREQSDTLARQAGLYLGALENVITMANSASAAGASRDEMRQELAAIASYVRDVIERGRPADPSGPVNQETRD